MQRHAMIRPYNCSLSQPRQLFNVFRAMTSATAGTTTTTAASATNTVSDHNHDVSHSQPTMGFDELFRRREEMMTAKNEKKKKEKVSMIGKGTELNWIVSSSSGSNDSGKPRQQYKRWNNNNNNNTTSHKLNNNNYNYNNNNNIIINTTNDDRIISTTNNRNNENQASQSYLDNLEQRARTHAQIRVLSFSNNDSTAISSQSLASWNRTTVEIIMLLSKLWGKDSRWHIQSTSEFDRRKLCRMVSMADELLTGLLSTKEHEIDAAILAKSKNNSIDFTRNNDTNSTIHRNDKERIMTRQKQKTLNTEILCSTVALGWSRCDPSFANDAPRRAEAILNKLESICSKLKLIDSSSSSTRATTAKDCKSRTLLGFDARDVTPSIKLYNHVLSCWSRSSDPIAEGRAKSLLDRMASSGGGGGNGINGDAFARPDTFSYNNMLNLYANRGDAKSAEAMLLQMESHDGKGTIGEVASADVYSYSIVINAFQKRFTSSGPGCGDRKDLERAEELLSTLVTKYEQSKFRDTRLRPSNVTFGTIISMYAQADRMARVNPDGEFNERKTRKWKANMLTRANDEEGNDVGWGAINAERVLNWMIGLSERERRSKNADDSSSSSSSTNTNTVVVNRMDMICPNTHNFATVMDAWAKAGKGVEGARRCQALLDRLVSLYDKGDYSELRPIPLCFGTVIDAWCKADDLYESAEQAESVLDLMEDLFLHRTSSNPKEMLSAVAYNMVIDAWSRRSGIDTADRAESILRRLVRNQQLTNNQFLLPDAISYTAVMKAYVNHPHGGEKALAVLKEMYDQYRNGNAKAKPDIRALAVAMDACAKSGLTSEAEKILSDVPDFQKSEVLFNTVISGYKSEGRGLEAEAVLRRMISLDKSGLHRCAPDIISFSLCIMAWGNGTSRERVSRVISLLQESIQRCKAGDNKCKPSHVMFNTVAECIANSDDPEKETRVLTIFEQMEEIGFQPSLVSFNILIKTCSSVTGNDERRRNALKIALSAFDSIPSVGLRPDSITYTGMIHTVFNLMEDSEERTKTVSTVFRRCCEDGCLNQHIMNILSLSLSEGEYHTLTGATSIEGLPSEWSRRASSDSMASSSSTSSSGPGSGDRKDLERAEELLSTLVTKFVLENDEHDNPPTAR